MAQFPGNGYLLDATANISGCFGTTSTTVVIAAHFNNASMRIASSTAQYPTILSCSLSGSGFLAGNSTTGGGKDFALQLNGASQTAQLGLYHNQLRNSAFVPDNSSAAAFGSVGGGGYRVITIMFNGSASAIGDISANSKWAAVNGWRNDGSNGVFAYNANCNPNGAITAGTVLAPTLMRLGGDTIITTISGSATNYYDNGIAELLVFNTALTLEQRQLAEGYLGQKYACQSTLGLGSSTLSTTTFIHPYRLTDTTPSLAHTTTNTYTQGLAAWFDAANASTFTLSGTSISGWAPAGGFLTNSLTQSNPLYQPTLVQNAQNGLPGVRFTVTGVSGTPLGTTSSYSPIQFSTLGANNEFTRFVVYTPTTSGQIVTTVSRTGRLLQYSNQFSYYDGITDQQKNYNVSGNVVTVNCFYRRANVTYVRQNGTQDAGSFTGTTNLQLPSGNYSIAVGAYSASSPNVSPYSGDIYEFALFRYALTDQQIFQIEGYLAWKWGLQNSLPSTHPYYRIRF